MRVVLFPIVNVPAISLVFVCPSCLTSWPEFLPDVSDTFTSADCFTCTNPTFSSLSLLFESSLIQYLISHLLKLRTKSCLTSKHTKVLQQLKVKECFVRFWVETFKSKSLCPIVCLLHEWKEFSVLPWFLLAVCPCRDLLQLIGNRLV